MDDLRGKVAVVTGGASGIGLAMVKRFAAEGMSVVAADVEKPALDAAIVRLSSSHRGIEGIVTDVSDPTSVDALAQTVFDRHGEVHVLCLNAGVGSGATGRMWEYERSDWEWALGVNVWGVIHGINAFVPRMLAQREGHVITTSSGNGGIAPLSSTPVYALTKGAVVCLTECLFAHLADAGSPLRASVLFPGPKMLRTGLWTSGRNRPEALAKKHPPATPQPATVEEWEAQMRVAGFEPQYTPTEDVASLVVEALRDGRFWIMAPSEETDSRIEARARSMLERSDPDYLRPFLAPRPATAPTGDGDLETEGSSCDTS